MVSEVQICYISLAWLNALHFKPHVNKTSKQNTPLKASQGWWWWQQNAPKGSEGLDGKYLGYRITAATVKVAECCEGLSWAQSPQSPLFFCLALPLSSHHHHHQQHDYIHQPPRRLKQASSQNKTEYKIGMGALAVTEAAELGLEDTESSSSGQFVTTLAAFKSNEGLLLTLLRVAWGKGCGWHWAKRYGPLWLKYCFMLLPKVLC